MDCAVEGEKDRPFPAGSYRAELQTVCAWCGRPISSRRIDARTPVSHGVCRSCVDDLLHDRVPGSLGPR